MNYRQLIDGMKRFGSKEEEICLFGLGVPADKINEHVILAPWWEPVMLPELGDAEYISASDHSEIKIWNIRRNDGSGNCRNMTYIKTGIGAPVLMDALLTLGVTKCRKVIFIGSVGALDENMNIGDIVVPQWSICGDGASRYIAYDSLKDGDVFGEKTYPDVSLYKTLSENTRQLCSAGNVNFHIGTNYSTDSIFAEYVHIDEIKKMGCNVIEMETAAAFRAAKIAGIELAALFSISDNSLTDKSLISGITTDDTQYRRFTRKTLFPQIIYKTFFA